VVVALAAPVTVLAPLPAVPRTGVVTGPLAVCGFCPAAAADCEVTIEGGVVAATGDDPGSGMNVLELDVVLVVCPSV
jgi:hypothetical protein